MVVAEHISVCDSEEERIADLSCGSGDCDSDGFFGFGEGVVEGSGEVLDDGLVVAENISVFESEEERIADL